MDRKIFELEKKVKFFQVTIDRIKKWIWLKYEDQIPNEFLDENDQNFEDHLVTCQLSNKNKGQIVIKEEILEDIIGPDLTDSEELEIDNFFQPSLSPDQIESQIEIEEKILPFDDPLDLSNDDLPNNSTNTNIGPKYLVMNKSKRIGPSIQKPKISIRSEDELENFNAKKSKTKKVLKRKNGSLGNDRNEMSKCKKCGKFLKKSYISRHMLLHIGKEKWRYVCGVEGCKKRFHVKTTLKEHYSVHMNPSRDEYSEEFTKNCPEEILKYLENRKKSLNKWWLSKGVVQYKAKISNGEIPSVLKDSCSVCGKTMARKTLRKHMKIHTGTLKLRFSCSVENCTRKYSTQSELHKHSVIHTNPKRKEYSEEYVKKCPEQVLKYLEKKNEKKTQRKNAKNIDCPTCGLSVSELNLTRHIKCRHKGQGGEIWKFPCQVDDCNLKFPLKTTLWEHYGVHLNPKTKIYSPEFKKKCPNVVLNFLENRKKNNNVREKKACSICGKEVTILNRHIQMVHEPESKRFPCEICPWKFHLKNTLWTHYSVHLNPRHTLYSEEFSKKCPQEILQFIKKTKKSKNKYGNKARKIKKLKKEDSNE